MAIKYVVIPPPSQIALPESMRPAEGWKAPEIPFEAFVYAVLNHRCFATPKGIEAREAIEAGLKDASTIGYLALDQSDYKCLLTATLEPEYPEAKADGSGYAYIQSYPFVSDVCRYLKPHIEAIRSATTTRPPPVVVTVAPESAEATEPSAG